MNCIFNYYSVLRRLYFLPDGRRILQGGFRRGRSVTRIKRRAVILRRMDGGGITWHVVVATTVGPQVFVIH
jgi:hypothetical protein